MSSEVLETEVDIRTVIMKDGDIWIAQCLEYDIGAQASDLETLQGRLGATLAAEYTTSMEIAGKPFAGIAAAPQWYHELWSRCGARLKPTVIPDGKPIHLDDLAICA